MRTIWILPGWFGFIFGSSPSGSENLGFAGHIKCQAAKALMTVREWHARWKQRLDLEGLPDHRLKDLGLSRPDAEFEASKPFWRQ